MDCGNFYQYNAYMGLSACKTYCSLHESCLSFVVSPQGMCYFKSRVCNAAQAHKLHGTDYYIKVGKLTSHFYRARPFVLRLYGHVARLFAEDPAHRILILSRHVRLDHAEGSSTSTT